MLGTNARNRKGFEETKTESENDCRGEPRKEEKEESGGTAEQGGMDRAAAWQGGRQRAGCTESELDWDSPSEHRGHLRLLLLRLLRG